MEGAPVRLRAIEDFEVSGISIPAGPYVGKEKIYTAHDKAGQRTLRYSLELRDTTGTIDVTPLVEVGKITVVRLSAL